MDENKSLLDVAPEIKEVLATAICLYDEYQIAAAIRNMATAITEQIAFDNPVVLGVMIGGIVPLGNLLPLLHFPLQVDTIHLSRYGHEIVGKEVIMRVQPFTSLQNRTVLIVDDILDEGLTLQTAVQFCQQQGAKRVLTAVLIDKAEARMKQGLSQADFTGLRVDNHFVFGYGLDYKGYWRNLNGIYRVAPEYEK